MSLQDDIFDVEAALMGKPVAYAFDRVLAALARAEASDIEQELFLLKSSLRIIGRYILLENTEKSS
jgi:hypothetical protein